MSRWITKDAELTIPLIGYLAGFLALMAGVFVLLIWLFQPVTIVNAGLAAYSPPPKTRLEPAARKMDAPELVELKPPHSFAASPEPDGSLSALAKGQGEDLAQAPPKQEVRRPIRKRQRTEVRRETREPYWGVASEWDGRYRSYDRLWQSYDRYGQQRNYRNWW